MNWKNLKIGTKLAVGFGLVLVLLGAVGGLSLTGVGSVVDNAGTVIDGHRLDGLLTQKVVDHLNWAEKVVELLTDEQVVELKVQTDDHKCKLGTWLYGEGREDAIKTTPSLAPFLTSLEDPHRKMHETAVKIKGVFKQPHGELAIELEKQIVNHLFWANKVSRKLIGKFSEEGSEVAKGGPRSLNDVAKGGSFEPNDPAKDARFSLGVQTDPTKCKLAKFMANPQTKEWEAAFPDLKAAFAALHPPHDKMHRSAKTIEDAIIAGDYAKAKKVYDTVLEPSLVSLGKLLKETGAVEESYLSSFKKAEAVYNDETIPHLQKVQTILNQVKAESKANIMSDDVMLGAAADTRRNVLVVALGAFLVGIVLAFFIAKAISGPVTNIAAIVRKVATDRDLTLKAPVTGKDEIGEMASEFNDMLGELHSSFSEVQTVSEEVAVNAVEVAKRASANRDRAEGEVVQSAKSQELIEAMGETAAKVAHGSLAQQEGAQKSQQTVAELLQSMNSVSEAVVKQSEEANTATERVGAMGTTGAAVVQTSSKQGETVMQVTTAMTEISAAVQNMAQAVDSANKSGEESLKSADDGKQAVDDTVAGMKAIAESSEQISEIIGVITEIAEQTNLLALNAAIEAARAGEHGKGFAVVADEVGKLAQRSSEAAKEITQLIKDSTNRVNEGTQNTKELQEALVKIDESGRDNMQSIEDISSVASVVETDIQSVQVLVEELNSLAQEISSMAGEQGARRKAAEDALGSMVQQSQIISTLVTEAGTGSKAIDDEMHNIVERTDEMSGMVAQQGERSQAAIKIATESAAGAKQTVQGAGVVVSITGDLEKASKKLQDQVAQFKL